MSSRREDPDRPLIARVENRDAEALGALYDRHSARLLGLSTRILGDTGEAEEVLQELFLWVWRSAGSFDPTRGSVLSWLLVATRSRSIDRLRARRPATRSPASLDDVAEIAAPDDVEAASSDREWEALCRQAVAELPAEQRAVLEMAYFQGLTQQEIAEKARIPLGTVKTRVRLGLMKLRERVRSYRMSEAHGT
jgi:RNA polymerase sigma-70 factor (ECF subfamily)